MLATLALSLTLLGPGAPKQNAAAALVSKMLKYYSDARTMTGTITLTASDGQGKAQLVTQFQFERPSKLYIRQVKGGADPMQWLVTSDGQSFSYDSPSNLPLAPKERLTEPVNQIVPNKFGQDATGKSVPVYQNYDIGQIYSVAAEASLGDRSIPLDIAISRPETLAHDDLTWMTVESGGKTTLNGIEANVVKGFWREYGDQVQDVKYAPGTFQMLIADDGKLLQYTILQKIGPNQIPLNETWDVDLTVDGKPDPNLFRLVR